MMPIIRRRRSARRWPAIVLAAGSAIGLSVASSQCHRPAQLPDFAAIGDTSTRKQAFIGYLLPLVQESNRRILVDRTRLLENRPADQSWIRRLGRKYGMPAHATLDENYRSRLLSRVDIVPPSLAIAQAAAESGWGTSRFAVEGNNLFGLRTYGEGEGIVPQKRSRGHTFKIASYEDAAASVNSYIHNLNTNSRYGSVRILRESARQAGLNPSGLALASGLHAYSAVGHEYIDLISSIISSNNLEVYDSPP